MALLVLLIGVIAFALLAPPPVRAAAAVAVAVSTAAVMVSARVVAGIRPTVWEALRAVALSLVFLALAAMALARLRGGGPGDLLRLGLGADGLAAGAGLWLAYGLGFVVGLGARLGPALLIAALATALSAGAWLLLARA
jgi:hypothetical protein